MERLGLLAALPFAVACQPTDAPATSPPSSGIEQNVTAMPEPVADAPAEPPATEQNPPAEVVPPADPSPEPEPKPELVSIETPAVLVRETIWRWSADDRPPWKKVTVANGVLFGSPPKKGEFVTVLPTKSSLPTVELAIRKVKKEDYGDAGRWTVTLEPIEDRAYFKVKGRDPAFPVDVVVVYPATPSAKLLPVKGLAPEDLPPSAPPGSVETAVDIDDDGRPDTVELTRCTDDPKRARCFEATAWETHRLVDGKWTLSHVLEPIS